MPISKDISADSKPVKDLSKFLRKITQVWEPSTHTEPYKNIDTQLIPIPSEEKSYNHIWEIGNVTPYLEKQESTISFPVETHPRISMEKIAFISTSVQQSVANSDRKGDDQMGRRTDIIVRVSMQ
nr:14191_t:CDS:2 [Entrophospora candida]